MENPNAERIEALASRLLARGWRLATAESCTGGLLAGALTALPGSSRWFERGWVTYSNAAKQEDLGVPAALLEQFGAVSEPVAKAMAEGALVWGHAQLAVAISGVAGPEGGTADKPVGHVCHAVAIADGPTRVLTRRHAGDRAAVRAASVALALDLLLEALAG